jgi:hypothetical protein
MRCPICKFNYSDKVMLSPLFISGKGYTNPICGICALEEIRKVHHSGYMFSGEMALENYNAAVRERKVR